MPESLSIIKECVILSEAKDLMETLFSTPTQIQSIESKNHTPVFSKGSVLCQEHCGVHTGPFRVGIPHLT